MKRYLEVPEVTYPLLGARKYPLRIVDIQINCVKITLQVNQVEKLLGFPGGSAGKESACNVGTQCLGPVGNGGC